MRFFNAAGTGAYCSYISFSISNPVIPTMITGNQTINVDNISVQWDDTITGANQLTDGDYTIVYQLTGVMLLSQRMMPRISILRASMLIRSSMVWIKTKKTCSILSRLKRVPLWQRRSRLNFPVV